MLIVVKGKTSPLTKPVYVYVNTGTAAPYNFDLSSAVIDNIFLPIINEVALELAAK